MRWSLIAIGILLTALLRFAFGRPEPRHPLPLEPPREEVPAARPVEPPPPPPPAPSGASILSLIEIGPVEVEPAAAAPVAAPEPPTAPVKPSGRAAEDGGNWLRQRRLNRACQIAIWTAARSAVDKCRGPQLARSPRLQGELRVEVTVQPQPGQPYGRLSEVEIDSPNMYMPLFNGCIQSALAAVSFPNPASRIELPYAFTLEHDVGSSEPDDDDSEDSDDGDGETDTSG